MKLRIWGTREECETVKRLVKPFMRKIQDNGRFYLNRGSNEIGRMYLDFELAHVIEGEVIDVSEDAANLLTANNLLIDKGAEI